MSIRQMMLTGMALGLTKDAIKAQVTAAHPDKMGAQKFDTHYAWYKARCRKASTAEAIELDRLIALRDLRSGIAPADLGRNPFDTKFEAWLAAQKVTVRQATAA